MIFYYALGGGLGHLTRAMALIHTLSLKGSVTIAFSPSREAANIVFPPSFIPLPVPESLNDNIPALREWLHTQLNQHAFQTIIVDAFPGGLFGELCDFKFPADVTLIHTARLLQWPRIQAQLRGNLPRYACVYVLETLAPAHASALAHCSNNMTHLELTEPPIASTHPQLKQEGQPLWLVVHAGSDDEIEALIGLARETALLESATPQLVLLSPARPTQLAADIRHIRQYPAWPFFEIAERIFSGCGFNTVRQLQPFRHKHRFLPFERKFDDQFERAARLRQHE